MPTVAPPPPPLVARERAERTFKDREGSLLQAERLEVLGSLAGGVAHDFNNLLGVIGGYAGLIQRDLPPESALAQDFQEIREAVRRGAALTRQLLAFSRREEVRPVALRLNEAVADMEKLLKRTIGENIAITVGLDPGLWWVHADPSRIDQVILNLAVNARDAMPEGGRLSIATRNVVVELGESPPAADTAPGRYVLLEVADTGTGMSQEILQHLFEPFFTTKPSGLGTGLGLSTVYGIVKQAGGQIHVSSEVNVGSTFRIYLPAAVEEPASVVRVEEVPELRGAGATVLLVEDDDALRAYLESLLTRSGYHVLVARNVREAIAVAGPGASVADVLVVDVMLPDGTGRDLKERLRAVRPALRAVFMSGYTERVGPYRSLIEEGVEVLQKPFHGYELLRRLRDVLGSGAREA